MKQERNTRQRRLVLEAARGRCDHPSAEQLYLDVHQKDPRVSRGTVYRNLNLLADNGELLHVKVPGADRFDLRCDPHYHIICTRCGSVEDVELPYQPQLDDETAQETGFILNRHSLVFEGICPRCQSHSES